MGRGWFFDAAVGDEGVIVAAGDVAWPDFGEVGFEVAFCRFVADPDALRADGVGAELGCEPEAVDGFAFAGFGPWAIIDVIKPVDEVATEDFVGFEFDEGDEDINEQRANDGCIGEVAGDVQGGIAGELWPVATNKVGKDKERFPDIGGAIVQGGWGWRAGGGDGLVMIEDKTAALATEDDAIEVAKTVANLSCGFALHGDADATVHEGVGQSANGGDDFGAPAREAEKAGTGMRDV